MRQKTINLRNQGSFNKNFYFFSQTLSHISRWVRLEQKTRAKKKFSRLGTFRDLVANVTVLNLNFTWYEHYTIIHIIHYFTWGLQGVMMWSSSLLAMVVEQNCWVLFQVKVIIGMEPFFPWTKELKDTNPLISSLLVIFVWGGEAIL